MRLKVEIQTGDGRTSIAMSGWMDERSEWPELAGTVRGNLVLDLGGITLLNSLGVRGWIRWLGELRVEGDVVLVNCSPSVLKQINILDGFLNDRTKIGSVFVPYFCEDCGREESRLIDVAALPAPPTAASAVREFRCPGCGMNMELDMVESQFMSFLGAHRAKFTSF